MKGKTFPYLEPYAHYYFKKYDTPVFIFKASSDSVLAHGEEWGYEILTNGPTVKANGLGSVKELLVALLAALDEENP